MGNKSTASWFTSFKRAFTPHKSTKTQHQNQHQDQDQDDDDKNKNKNKNKILHKREKRRWLFKKSSSTTVQQQQTQLKVKTSSNDTSHPVNYLVEESEKHAILMAEAAIKAAEAAATTAHVAAEIIRLTAGSSSISVNHHFAAILIQTSFRGYLARRALRALKGIVILQAVIRGQNVRKQAVMTLRCMQALIRVQSRVHGQRSRLSHYESRKSMTSENDSLLESKYLQDIKRRKSMVISRDGSYIPDDWSDKPHNLEELDAMLKNRKKSNRNGSTMDDKELEETANWLDQWIRAKQWENQRTNRRDFIKNIEIDGSRPSSRSGGGGYKHPIPNSPSRRSIYSPSNGQQPITPSPIKTMPLGPLQIRSASPRCLKEERSYLNANLRLTPRVIGSMCRNTTCANDMLTVPNYMAATESARARIRSLSTPRHRPSTPERDRIGFVKIRLAYPVMDPRDNRSDNYNNYGHAHNLRSPSFKSVQVGHVGMGQQWSNEDSTTGGELSPCSTTDLRKWLR